MRYEFLRGGRPLRTIMTTTITTTTIDYTQPHLILAPMVRVGTLPSRLLALKYGATLVYSEELIDFRFASCRRVENRLLDTVDFVDNSGKVIFRTCDAEKDRVVFQMGTADANRALHVAKLVEKDVAAIDVNMGCPKDFSLKGGMGAALLSNPSKIQAILGTLVHGVAKPVTCKIRLLDTVEDTVALCKTIEETGIAALAVHARKIAERPRERGHYEYIRAIVDALKIPVIANGGSLDIKRFEDIASFREATGCKSVMVAKSAENNMSVFCSSGLLDAKEVVREFLRLCVRYDNYPENTKYVAMQIMSSAEYGGSDLVKSLAQSQSLLEMCSLWGLENEYEDHMAQRREKAAKLAAEDEASADGPSAKRQRAVSELDVVLKTKPAKALAQTSKSSLVDYCRENHLSVPEYDTQATAARFYTATVEVNGQLYSTSNSYISKKMAEQAAALSALGSLGVIDRQLIVGGASDMSVASSRTRPNGTGRETSDSETIAEPALLDDDDDLVCG